MNTDLDTLIRTVTALLPFPTEIHTDMGADTWEPQIYFGPTDTNNGSGLPAHRAGIDRDSNRPVWWIDLDDGTRTILLNDLTLEDAATVAARIIASTSGPCGHTPTPPRADAYPDPMTPDEDTTWLGFAPNCRQCLVQLEAVDDPKHTPVWRCPLCGLIQLPT